MAKSYRSELQEFFGKSQLEEFFREQKNYRSFLRYHETPGSKLDRGSYYMKPYTQSTLYELTKNKWGNVDLDEIVRQQNKEREYIKQGFTSNVLATIKEAYSYVSDLLFLRDSDLETIAANASESDLDRIAEICAKLERYEDARDEGNMSQRQYDAIQAAYASYRAELADLLMEIFSR